MNFFLSIVYFVAFLSVNILQASNSNINDDEKQVSTLAKSSNSNARSFFNIANLSEDNYNLMNSFAKSTLECMFYELDAFPTVKKVIDGVKNMHGAINICVQDNLKPAGSWCLELKTIFLDRDMIISDPFPFTFLFELCNAYNPFMTWETPKKFCLNKYHYAFFLEAAEHMSLSIHNQIKKEYLQHTQRFYPVGTRYYDYFQNLIEDITYDTFMNHWQEMKITNIEHVEYYEEQFTRRLGLTIFPSSSKIDDIDCQILITSTLCGLSFDIAKKEAAILKISIQD